MRSDQPTTTPPAFRDLYDQNVERVYRYHLARTGAPADAEDLTAETFWAALRSFERLQKNAPSAAWLMGIARHKLADHFRRSLFRGRPRVVALDELPDPPLPGPSLEEQAGQRLEMARVSAALRQLNAERAEAIALHYFAGLALAEVAQAMGKSEEAAKKLVQRGLSELRQRLGIPRPETVRPQERLSDDFARQEDERA